jgi:hypothetical protein
MRISSILLAGTLAALGSGCDATLCPPGEPECIAGTGTDPSSDRQEERTLLLEPGALSEAGFSMTQGDSVDIEYTIDGAAVVWNVHTHDIDPTSTHAQGLGKWSAGRGAVGSFTFVAPADGEYWSVWINDQSAPIEIGVSYIAHGSAAFRGWR